jgi:cation transport regulator ChaC
MQESRFAYFGYGSLVNRETLRTPIIGARRVRLKGWRRHWQERAAMADPAIGGGIALLSVHRCEDAAIDGLAIEDRLSSLPDLDRREAMYDRHALEEHEIEHHHEHEAQSPLPGPVQIYVGRERGEGAPGSGRGMLLQSYVDAVMAGFLREFGEAGVTGFLSTTEGFEREMIADRANPRYPRAVAVPDATSRWFDELLAEKGVVFRAP